MATVQNALGLLNLFTQNRPEIGLTQFKNLSGFDKGTTNRYLKALQSLGYLEQDTETKAYRLGPAIVRLATIRENAFPVGKIAAMHVDELAVETGELVHASLYTEDGMSSLHHCDGGMTGTRVGFDPAELLPLHATSSGIAMLAFGESSVLDKAMKRSLNQYTNMTVVDHDSVRATVDEVRELGFSHMSQSYEAEVASIAIPFFDGSEHAVGTIAVATPRFRMTEEFRIELLSKAIDTSRSISIGLGARTPRDVDEKWANLQMKAEQA